MILQTKKLRRDAANMKAGRFDQEAPRRRMAWLMGWRSIGEGVFGVKLRARQTLTRPLPSRPMQHGQASLTAVGAAGHRAAHQVLERGPSSPTRSRSLSWGRTLTTPSRSPGNGRSGGALRLFIAMRSRFAEDCAARAIENGVRQIIVLGAGLDTFAYRLEPTQPSARLRARSLRLPKPKSDAGSPKRGSRSPRTSPMSLTISSMGA